METVVDGVHLVGSGYVNAFMVDGDQGVVLIDTGLPKKEGLVTKALAAIGRGVDDVVAIVLTHSHADHTGSAAALKALTGARVIASPVDTPAIQGEEPIPVPPMLAGPVSFLGKLVPKPTPVTVDDMVAEDDQVGLPDDFSAIDTPGHTPGHTSYLLERSGGVLFVGDAAAADKTGEVTRGFPNARGGSVIDTSIRHLATFDFEVAVFGHFGPITTGASGAFRAYSG
ncbi:MAG: MBL fold metallo-hydrolase [Acidimicrobiia bacterium]|jgi:glyoxylase-like metal-dependent hydrolase (beta-lactamase superfamily II)